jgi:IclR family mhp operon transcriptional activator
MELVTTPSAWQGRRPEGAATEPIHGLEKGLDVLAFVNTRNEVSVAEVVRACELPRTTALRVLETLRLSGYLERVGEKKKYRLTIKVRTLAGGFDDESWISDVARPHIQTLGRAVVWPVLMATPRGSVMVVRENTDFESPLALVRWTTGTLIPLEESATGLCYLAHCGPDNRRFLLELIALHPYSTDWGGRETVEQRIAEAQQNGYALYARKHHREVGLSVPIFDQDRYLASLTVRYIYGSLTVGQMLEKNLAPMQETAAAIGAEFSARVRSIDPWAARRSSHDSLVGVG